MTQWATSTSQAPDSPPSRLVLLADAEPRSARYVTRCLRGSGYRVVLANNIDGLLAAEAREQPAVVLLDEELPGSVEAVRLIRDASEVPIIFLSLVNEPVASAGLRAGADAVIMKPFTAELLRAEIESIIRRSQIQSLAPKEKLYRFNGLLLDFGARAVMVRGKRLHLSMREYGLLHVLATNCGRVLTHDQLLRLVWGPGYEDSNDLLRGYIRNLRKKLGDDARHTVFIHTENQVGYWMERSEEQ